MLDSISIVVPAYNEEKLLSSTLTEVSGYCKKNFREYEIIVVDDCSKDRTSEIAASFHKEKVRVLHNDANQGKGYSVRRGVLESKHALVLYMDADSSVRIKSLDYFLPSTEQGIDIVIGSRKLSGGKAINQRPHRKALSRVFSFFVGLFVFRGFSDSQCGFKLFRSSAAKDIFILQTVKGFSFDVEVLFIAMRRGYRIAEIPVTYTYVGKSSVKPFRDSARMLRDILAIRLNDMKGVYDKRVPSR